ncbi:MAG: DHHA1 domain-containing protein [Candidatus Micrarchaeia archaeon]
MVAAQPQPSIGLRQLYDFLLQQGQFTVTSHFLADVDGACSAFLLKSLFPQAQVVFFDRPSREARKVCDAYGLEYKVSLLIDPQHTVLVDVDDPLLIPPLHHKKYLALIDHHYSKKLNAEFRLSDHTAPSTTYLIYLMMKAAGVAPSRKQAEMILLGILADTNRFKSVENTGIFADVAVLFDTAGKSYDSLLSLLTTTSMSSSERLVFVRSFKDFRILRSARDDLLFIITDCASFQSLVADRLIECMEVDFGLAYARVGNEVRVSLRSSPRLALHLGTFASALASRLGGSGGGHKHAAGLNLPPISGKKIEEEAIRLLKETFPLKEH